MSTQAAAAPPSTAPGSEEMLGRAYDARLMRRLWPFVRPHWGLAALAFVLIPLGIAFEVAQPYLLKIAIDNHIALHAIDGLATVAGLFVSCVILQALSGYAQLYALQLLGQRSMHDLRQATYRHVITRRAAFYDRMPVGRLLTRMTNDIENINEMFASGVVTLLADGLKLLAIIGMMFYLNVTLTLITFMSFPLLAILVVWARNIMRNSFREIRV